MAFSSERASSRGAATALAAVAFYYTATCSTAKQQRSSRIDPPYLPLYTVETCTLWVAVLVEYPYLYETLVARGIERIPLTSYIFVIFHLPPYCNCSGMHW